MSDVSVLSAIDGILRREGGYVDHPDDRGGPTNYGITQRTLEKWRGSKVTKDDVKKLTRKEASRIYWNMYVKPLQFILGRADQRTADLIIDSAVHHGPERAIRWVQQGLGVKPDAQPGPDTIDAFSKADMAELYKRVYGQRKQLLDRLGEKMPAFDAGWQKRLGEFDDAG